jgi:hypothetical protein
VIGGALAGIARLAEAARRASIEPVLVRAGAFAAALSALLVATPPQLPGSVIVLSVVGSVLPALAPAGPWVTVVVLAAATGWLVDTGLTGLTGLGLGFDGIDGIDPGRLLVLAGTLYLLHSLAALAATLPYDAVVATDVLTRWLVRALGVVVASSLLSVAVLVGLAQLTDARAYVLATLGGLALAVALAALLRASLGRRDRHTSRSRAS